MGLRSWKKEFYPISAQEVAVDGDERTIIAHSLLKWQGLLPENLKKHNVMYDGWQVENKSGYAGHGSGIYIDSSSCSLCEKYFMTGLGESYCSACPLYKVRGRVSCTACKRSEKIDPYGAGSLSKPNPRPMIRWLKRTLTAAKKKQVKRAKRVKS